MTTQTFPLAGPVNLHARLGSGSITVHAQDDLAEASVTIEPRVADSDVLERVTVELRGPTLHITAPRQGGVFDLISGRRERDSVDITVTIPSGTAIKISSMATDIRIDGRSGSIDFAGGLGDVDVARVDGEARLRYGSGTFRIGPVSGSMTVRTGSGSVHVAAIGGALSSACGSGELVVDSVRGAVRTRAGSGGASLGAVFGDVDVASGSGPLSIGLPSGQLVKLDVTTGSGRVDSELPVDSTPMSKGHPITVRARTGSGNIRVFRAA